MKKIALIGSAPSSVGLAPYNDPNWQVWGCSPGSYGVIPPGRSDAFFELHRYEPGQPWFSEGYCKFLSEHKRLIVSGPDPRLPNAEVLDVKKLVSKYGPYFFTSSLAWMVAMAIEEGATTIGLWGVDMSATEEYGYQRAGLQFFAMLCKSLGIELGIPPESDLLQPPPLYGVCEQNHEWIKALQRQREFDQRIAAAEARKNEAQQELMFMQGAKDDLKYVQNTFLGRHEEMPHYTESPDIPVLKGLVNTVEVSEQPKLVDVLSVEDSHRVA